MATAKALFVNNQYDVTSTTDLVGFPSYWTKQLKSGDYIFPTDSTVVYTIQRIISDSSLILSVPYDGVTGNKTYGIISNYPLYDDDAHTGAKVVGIKSDNFLIDTSDFLSVTIDGINQTCVFPYAINDGQIISNVITQGLHGGRASYEWVTDLSNPYGYKQVLILRTTNSHNQLVIHQDSSGTAVKLGLLPSVLSSDATYIGNNDNTAHKPELLSINNENLYLVNEYSSLMSMLSVSNKLLRNPADASAVYVYCFNEFLNVGNEYTKVFEQILALNNLVKETTVPSYSRNVTALQIDTSSFFDCYNAYQTDYTTLNDIATRGALKWSINLTYGAQYITPTSDVRINFQCSSGYNCGFVDATIESVYYAPVSYFQDTLQPIDGTFDGTWTPAPTGNRYTTDNFLSFTVTDHTDMLILTATDATSHSYSNDIFNFYVDGTPFPYITYPLISNMKTAINAFAVGVAATGNTFYDSYAAGFRGSGIINPDATVYPGLRPCIISYYTINDKSLGDRTSFYTNRTTQLNNRKTFLYNRESQIFSDVLLEEYLRASDGATGNIYNWANNRFNRNNGCEARLKQIEKQIQMNQAGLQVNKNQL